VVACGRTVRARDRLPCAKRRGGISARSRPPPLAQARPVPGRIGRAFAASQPTKLPVRRGPLSAAIRLIRAAPCHSAPDQPSPRRSAALLLWAPQRHGFITIARCDLDLCFTCSYVLRSPYNTLVTLSIYRIPDRSRLQTNYSRQPFHWLRSLPRRRHYSVSSIERVRPGIVNKLLIRAVTRSVDKRSSVPAASAREARLPSVPATDSAPRG